MKKYFVSVSETGKIDFESFCQEVFSSLIKWDKTIFESVVWWDRLDSFWLNSGVVIKQVSDGKNNVFTVENENKEKCVFSNKDDYLDYIESLGISGLEPVSSYLDVCTVFDTLPGVEFHHIKCGDVFWNYFGIDCLEDLAISWNDVCMKASLKGFFCVDEKKELQSLVRRKFIDFS